MYIKECETQSYGEDKPWIFTEEGKRTQLKKLIKSNLRRGIFLFLGSLILFCISFVFFITREQKDFFSDVYLVFSFVYFVLALLTFLRCIYVYFEGKETMRNFLPR